MEVGLNISKYKAKKIIYILLSLFISYILIFPDDIMWAKDREWYLIYAEFSIDMIKTNYNKSLIVLLFNEPLFLLINSTLSFLFSPETIIKIIIFASSFLTLYSLGCLSDNKMILLFILIISPPFLLKYTSHIRQGLAMSLYFWGLVGYQRNKKYKNNCYIK